MRERTAHRGRTVAILVALCMMLQRPAIAGERMEYHDFLDSFFALLAEQKPGEAIDSIYRTSPYLQLISDQVTQLKIRLSSSSDMFGDYLDHSILIDKLVAQRYAYVYAFVAYERQPLKMEFHFYKPKDEWVLQKYSYSDEVDDDIAAAARYDLIE